jgi:cytochrome c-type biogenesis protein CcmH/NrfG
MGVVVAAVLAWLSSPLYTLGALAAAGVTALVLRVVGPPRLRGLAAAGVLVLALAVLNRAFQHGADPAPSLPDQPRSIALSLPPTEDEVQALVAADPGSSDTWMAAGFVLPRSQPTDPGVVAFERVLLMDPSQSRAALELAQTFLSFGSAQLDEEVAAYYTAVGGYPAPDLGPKP